MVFSSLLFLYAFLPLNLLFYVLARGIRMKNVVMLLFSLVFYAWGEPKYVLLLIGMTLADWVFALIMDLSLIHIYADSVTDLPPVRLIRCAWKPLSAVPERETFNDFSPMYA